MSGVAYQLDQCALYKTRSKNRLAEILHIGVPALKSIAADANYKVFVLPSETCEFTGKIRKSRQVEEPKKSLKTLHERIRDLLSRVAHPDYAHAAVKKRSYRSNAEFHKASDVAATFDVKAFYPSTSEQTVFLFFLHQLKCAPDVAGLLSRLVCYRAIPDKPGCLPTGSPLSPLLSIYANKPMFDALERLARERDLKFTCYVDDLTFSGAVVPANLERRVASIVKSHGHALANAKSRFFGKGMPKHITGVVLHQGKVAVPFGRFKKARRIEMAISKAEELPEKIRLMRKLSGLLGEAAYLDGRYKIWATKSYRRLAAFQVQVRMPSTTISSSPAALASPAAQGSAAAAVPGVGEFLAVGESAPWD